MARTNSHEGCPGELATNGQQCEVNSMDACPDGYTCLSTSADDSGICCKGKPKCLQGFSFNTTGGEVRRLKNVKPLFTEEYYSEESIYTIKESKKSPVRK